MKNVVELSLRESKKQKAIIFKIKLYSFFSELRLLPRRFRRLRERDDINNDDGPTQRRHKDDRVDSEIIFTAEIEQLVRIRNRIEPEIDRWSASQQSGQTVFSGSTTNGHLRRRNAEFLLRTFKWWTEMVSYHLKTFFINTLSRLVLAFLIK